jgi:hypothetical protein
MDQNLEIENEFCKLQIKDGILYSWYKEGVVIDLQAAKQIVIARHELIGEREYPVLVFDEGAKEVKRDARIYLSTEEGMKGITAGAFIVTNPVTKMVIQFWLSLNVIKSNFPIKSFSKEHEAVQWLSSYK